MKKEHPVITNKNLALERLALKRLRESHLQMIAILDKLVYKIKNKKRIHDTDIVLALEILIYAEEIERNK